MIFMNIMVLRRTACRNEITTQGKIAGEENISPKSYFLFFFFVCLFLSFRVCVLFVCLFICFQFVFCLVDTNVS